MYVELVHSRKAGVQVQTRREEWKKTHDPCAETQAMSSAAATTSLAVRPLE